MTTIKPMSLSNNLSTLAKRIGLNTDGIEPSLHSKVCQALENVVKSTQRNPLSNQNLQDVFVRELILSSKIV